MKKALLILVTGVILASCNASQKKDTPSEPGTNTENSKTATYICPMDCEKGKTYTAPGKCPVCGMDLELKH